MEIILNKSSSIFTENIQKEYANIIMENIFNESANE